MRDPTVLSRRTLVHGISQLGVREANPTFAAGLEQPRLHDGLDQRGGQAGGHDRGSERRSVHVRLRGGDHEKPTLVGGQGFGVTLQALQEQNVERADRSQRRRAGSLRRRQLFRDLTQHEGIPLGEMGQLLGHPSLDLVSQERDRVDR